MQTLFIRRKGPRHGPFQRGEDGRWTRATLLVGATKLAFLLDQGPGGWSVRGPFCGAPPINHMAGDPATGALWAAVGEWDGAGIWRSDDGGGSCALSRLARGKFGEWLEAEPAMAAEFGREPAPPAPFDGRLHSVWSLARASHALYAGSKPAALFRSDDGGEAWAELEGLTRHPSSDDWQPGGAGLTLHSIVAAPEAPERLWVGISAAGVFASEDGGASWERRNRLQLRPRRRGGRPLRPQPGPRRGPGP